MLSLKQYEEVKHIMQVGYEYAQTLHHEGHFDHFEVRRCSCGGAAGVPSVADDGLYTGGHHVEVVLMPRDESWLTTCLGRFAYRLARWCLTTWRRLLSRGLRSMPLPKPKPACGYLLWACGYLLCACGHPVGLRTAASGTSGIRSCVARLALF